MATTRHTSRGFTLLEVSFATGILFLTLVLILGAIAHIAYMRELGERRHLATVCLNHVIERARANPEWQADLVAPESLPGTYSITVDFEAPGIARVTVTAETSRGSAVVVSAVCPAGEGSDAP